ncbi:MULTISPECIES: DNA-processing protein DprA [unclassified Sutcliffiella]|uniref:DNA-processing protein DprA n=1 Tax=unclassified Sutcliffiella TaxID=2837532 RepID=UPI0030CC0CB8
MQLLKERLITLHHCPQLSCKTIKHLLRHDPTLENLYKHAPSDIASFFSINHQQADAIHQFIRINNMVKLHSIYKEQNIQLITIFDHEYPSLLKEIYDPPLVLYLKGNQHLLNTRKLGVVGARNMSSYGREALGSLIPPLIRENFTIVSGLAKGVDIHAHCLAMKMKGNTIAVLGSGIFNIYPKEHKELAYSISQHHLLLSEYPPYTAPTKWNFPMRNRIISGLSEGVIVVEAKEKSGSLITADQAMDQGREVFAVPGSILSETSKGTNSLIKQGAKLVADTNDILEELNGFKSVN